MHTLLQDLAVVMIVAGLVTIVCHRFKQPVVLGYILAGVIIGPHTPPFPLIHDRDTINTLAELGVILLMFSLGLEFSLGKLKRVGAPAFIAASAEITVLFGVGYGIARWFDWPVMDGIFLGAMLSMSSSTVIVKVLGELGKMRERFAQLIFGILIIEDILGIAMIALLSGIALSGSLSVLDIGVTLGKLGTFMTVTLLLGLLFVPRLIGYVAKFKSNEMMIVTVLALCFGCSLLASKLGYSVALGAFLIGAVIAEAREIHRIETLAEPVRDMFSAIFFVTIGLLIDPKVIVEHWLPVLVITLAVVVGKVLTCSFGAFVGGNDSRTSLRVGMGLAQIGEFSFIIAALGVTHKVTSDFLYPIAVAVSVLTTLLTPYLIRSSDSLVNWFDRVAPRSVANSLGLYTNWVGQLGSQREGSFAAKLIRRWISQMALNVVLITGMFIAAGYVLRNPPGFVDHLHLSYENLKAALWLAAALVSLPMFIATFRKLEALGMLLAEIKVTETQAGQRTAAIRAIVARIVLVSGMVLLGTYVLVLSYTLLPSWHLLAVLLAVVAGITWLLWRSFIKVYSKAQVALAETFAQQPPPRADHAPAPLPALLRDADLETITLAADSPAAGKLIREIELRSKTGASIVGIERGGTSLINPGPDEELQPGNQILLLGTTKQLAAARAALQPGTAGRPTEK